MRTTYTYSISQAGMAENELSPLKVYPNPARDVVFVSFGKAVQGMVSLIDLQGKVLHTAGFDGTESVVSLAGVPAGSYFLRVEGENGVEVRKVEVLK